MNITQSDFHTNRFSGFRHTPSPKSHFIMSYFITPRVTPLYYHYSCDRVLSQKKKYYLHHYLDQGVYNYISFYESGT